SRDLRHHQMFTEELLARNDVAAWIKTVYLTLSNADGDLSASDLETLDQVKREFDTGCRAFGVLVAKTTRSSNVLAKITELERALEKRDACLAGAEQKIQERDACLAGAEQKIQERDACLAGAEQKIQERDACLAAAEQRIRVKEVE